MNNQAPSERVTLRFHTPPPVLQPYISSLYLMDIALAETETISDWLMPEWASIRMGKDTACLAALGAEPMATQPQMMVAGPTSYAMRVQTGSAKIWGVGLLPLGWARLLGVPADRYANRLVDGRSEPDLAALAPAYGAVMDYQGDHAATFAAVAGHFLQLLESRPPLEDEAMILAAHRLLIDEDIATVGEFAERLGVSTRTLERLCLRIFGFAPKLLLRRQRFTRSLAQFLLDPSLAWTSTLDTHYVDQAHFVRDFKRFMGMKPSSYAAADKPILRATVHARSAAVGGAVQALHRP